MGIRGELYSTKVTLENRTYFFNVKENRLGDLYLNMVESKNKDAGGFERQSIVLFADDLQEFLKGFDDSLKVMEKAVREKKKTARADRDEGFGKKRFERDEGERPRRERGDERDEGFRPKDRGERSFEKRDERDGARKAFGPKEFGPKAFGPKAFGPKPFGAGPRGGADRKPFGHGPSDRKPFGHGPSDRKPFGHGPADRKPFSRGDGERSGFRPQNREEGDFARKKFAKGGAAGAGAHGMKHAARKARVVRAVRRTETPED